MFAIDRVSRDLFENCVLHQPPRNLVLNEFNTRTLSVWLRKHLVLHLLRRLFGVCLTKNTSLLALVALIACACGGSTGNQDSLDAQLRLATDPVDVKAHRSLARLAYAEARPGEVVRSLLLV